MNSTACIRPATRADISRLLALENRCFSSDRLSRRNFGYLINKANALTLLAEGEDGVYGYAMVLFSRGTSAARLYSIAIDHPYRRHGFALALLHALESAALARDAIYMRLEIRADNHVSQTFFKKHGYKKFGVVADYYEDHEQALRFEKLLAPHLAPDLVRVPYYQQGLDFTCGPAALMMAMGALNSRIPLNPKLELRLWREATTIFMTSGHGGCGPYGMALAAYKRGFGVEIYLNSAQVFLVDSVRSPMKKEVMRLVQEDLLEELANLPIPLAYRPLSLDELRAKFEAGAIPVVLISSYRIYHEKFPHWVVVTGFDDKYIYIHDPFVDEEREETIADCINMPILQKDFARMSRYGKSGQRAVVIIKNQ
jgi:ribosomal protein S18 acetylase RimI-like enzyme